MYIKIFSALRRVNKQLKKRRKERAGTVMSPVRRIEFVSPPASRVCAMTFDDGPTAAPCVPAIGGQGLTARLLDVLAAHRARATFDVIGSTAENYPDAHGDLHGHFVFGVKYDHYAAFGRDGEAGAVACPDLLRRIAREGHEIANHGYRHRIFGPEYWVYRKRAFQRDLGEVTADLQRLHDIVRAAAGYEIKLARPPHYIDRVGRLGRDTAYTAYAQMGYHYMAASVDGGGWYPTTGDYDADVRAMVAPLEKMLRQDPDSLSGAVIFQKDGYNMSMQSPVADALGLQLALLAEYGYQVVGVEALLRLSPFEDVAHDDEALDAVRGLETAGYTLGFQNNRFHPDAPVTGEQLAAMMTKRAAYTARRAASRVTLSPDAVRRAIAAKFGGCPPVRGGTRRDAAMALWEAVSPASPASYTPRTPL